MEFLRKLKINGEFRWYFTETNRRDAERFLEQPHNGKGTFLIRPSDTNQGRISLVERIEDIDGFV